MQIDFSRLVGEVEGIQRKIARDDGDVEDMNREIEGKNRNILESSQVGLLFNFQGFHSILRLNILTIKHIFILKILTIPFRKRATRQDCTKIKVGNMIVPCSGCD